MDQTSVEQTPKPVPEQVEVALIDEELKVKYRDTPKFRLWLQLFSDKGNKKTFGNQTQSAIEAYGLDPVAQYDTAAVIGHKNIKKVKFLARTVYNQMGVTYGTVLAAIWKKAIDPKYKNNDLLAWVTEVSDIELPAPLPTTKADQTVVNNNTQINVNEVNIKQLDDSQLQQLIDSRYAQIARRTLAPVSGDGQAHSSEPVEIHATTPETVPSNV